ncbi:hypothetical protein V495_00110 [Pseudogymnoascus sp. VKM F-4514 (FW-929)]|nr:hypothetical protein V495_00110 [Pseudogymnoascus sp. VKM F-4514 (FW-929)]KFY67356.1 hypothetical protein V497_00410 [Pseudogymnoascus sp. VKM F-4516 (FW-969)]
MTDVAEILNELNLTQYLDSFLQQGFETWDIILDITESDLNSRGRSQRHRGISHDQGLAPPKRRPSGKDDEPLEEGKRVTTAMSEGNDGTAAQTRRKRKYRRHPKPDENAPAKPPSSYVFFSNKMRADLKDKSLSFTDIAKLVGKKWQSLTPSEKELYEQQSFAAKRKFITELVEYRKTESYKTYAEYLLHFKAKQPHIQEVGQEVCNKTLKVQKLEDVPSATSTGTAKCNIASSLSREASSDMRSRAHPLARYQASANAPSTILTTYRETVSGANLQTFACWDHASRMEIPNLGYSWQDERNASQPGILNGPDMSFGFTQTFHNQPRSVGASSPSSLTSEPTPSTLQSTLSIGNKQAPQSQPSIASYFEPRSPLDQSCDRPLLPTPQNSPGAKPGGTLVFHKAYPCLIGIFTMGYSSISHADHLKPHTRTSQLCYSNTTLSMNDDPTPLDPVSALLRAGEIYSSQGRLAYPQHLQQQ